MAQSFCKDNLHETAQGKQHHQGSWACKTLCSLSFPHSRCSHTLPMFLSELPGKVFNLGGAVPTPKELQAEVPLRNSLPLSLSWPWAEEEPQALPREAPRRAENKTKTTRRRGSAGELILWSQQIIKIFFHFLFAHTLCIRAKFTSNQCSSTEHPSNTFSSSLASFLLLSSLS